MCIIPVLSLQKVYESLRLIPQVGTAHDQLERRIALSACSSSDYRMPTCQRHPLESAPHGDHTSVFKILRVDMNLCVCESSFIFSSTISTVCRTGGLAQLTTCGLKTHLWQSGWQSATSHLMVSCKCQGYTVHYTSTATKKSLPRKNNESVNHILTKMNFKRFMH